MKILHVINKLSFDGGPSITVPRICAELEKLGHEVKFCSPHLKGTNLPDDMKWCDVVHLTGVYNFVVLVTLFYARRYHKPIVWSPRGGWQRYPGSRKPHLKAIWDALCRKLAPSHTVIHATSELEAQSIMPVMPRPIRVIANGVDVPETLLEKEPSEQLRVLYLGRIDPKKGIEKVLAVMERVDPWFGVTLKIVGDGPPAYVAKLKALSKDMTHVRWCGHVEHARLPYVFQQTDVTIVPSEIESFGQVVVESLAHGVPVIASKDVPFVLHDQGCGVSIDMRFPPLMDVMNFLALKQQAPEILTQMGEMGRDWMTKEFRWEDKAREMEKAYEFASSLVSVATLQKSDL